MLATWQVVRSEFDHMMLNNAREHGVDVREGTRVHDVLFEGDRAVGVKIKEGDGSFRDVRAKVVVDASGQNGLLMNRMRLRVWDPFLNKGAIWTYWQGAYRDTGKDEGATLVIQTGSRKGGLVYPASRQRRERRRRRAVRLSVQGTDELAQTYDEEVEQCPGVQQRVAGATRVTGYFATKDYSYRSKRVAGNGWVLVGDAFGFLDPLYSSGVLLALKSGELAADAVVKGLATCDTSAAQLGSWGAVFNEGVDRMRRLVCEYYAGSVWQLVKKYPDLQGTLTDILIGDLFTDRVTRCGAARVAVSGRKTTDTALGFGDASGPGPDRRTSSSFRTGGDRSYGYS